MPDMVKGPPPVPPVEEKTRLPDTEAERLRKKLEEVAKESDEERSLRRHKELLAHLVIHVDNVKAAHRVHPTPDQKRSLKEHPFEDWSREDQLAWNAKRAVIDSANRAYHLAVKRTFNDHINEDAHLTRLRLEALTTA